MAPYLAVCTDDELLDALVAEFRAAGWSTVTLGDAEVADTTAADATPVGTPVLLVGPAHRVEHTASVVELLLAGGAVAVAGDDERAAADVYYQGRRLARTEWFDRDAPPCSLGLS